MAKNVLNVTLPAAGVNRSAVYQTQPPYTSPQASNMRAFEDVPGRARLCTRPGLGRYVYQRAGTGPINLMHVVEGSIEQSNNAIEDNLEGVYAFPASGFFNNGTASVTWLESASVDLLDKWYYTSGTSLLYGALLTDVSQRTSSDPLNNLSAHLSIRPYRGSHNAEYHMYTHLLTSAPNPDTGGVDVKIVMTTVNGEDIMTVTARQAGAAIQINSSSSPFVVNMGYHESRTFRLYYEMTTAPSHTLKLAYGPTTSTDPPAYLSVNINITGTAFAGTQRTVGWSMKSGSSSHLAIVDSYRFTYNAESAVYRDVNRLTLAAGGTVYQESIIGDINAVAGSCTVNDSDPLMAAQRLGFLYIADYGDVLYSDANALIGWTTAVVGPNDVNTMTIESTPAVDLSALGINANDFVVEVISVPLTTTTIQPGIYAITGFAGGSNERVVLARQLTGPTPTVPTGSTANIRIRRMSKYLATSGGTMINLLNNPTADMAVGFPYGSPPVGCPIVFEYRDRLVWVKDNQWFMSRQGDPGDYNYGADPADPGRAISGSTSEAGDLALDITAGFALGDDRAVLSTTDRIWVLYGDPAYSGQILPLGGKVVGIIDRAAWTITPDGWIYFLSRDGVYRVSTALGSLPEPVSRAPLPAELLNVDTNRFYVQMAYDSENVGVVLIVARLGAVGGSHQHYWIDLRNGGLWPMAFATGYDPLAITREKGYFRSRARVLLGSRDGHIRTITGSARTDDRLELTNYVILGPFRGSSQPDIDAGLDELVAILGQRTETCAVSVYGANTAEEALRAALYGTAQWSDTLTRGMNVGKNPRVRGAAFCVKLSAGGPVQIDELVLTAMELGKTRP